MTESLEVLRPYAGIDGFQGALDDLELLVKNQGKWTGERAIELIPEDFMPLRMFARWPLTGDTKNLMSNALKKTQLTEDEVSFAVIARCPETKQIKVLQRIDYSSISKAGGLAELELDLSSRPKAISGRNISLSFILYLNKSKGENFPYPYLKGTWLEMVNVEVLSTDTSGFNFTWEKLTNEVRRDRSLHKNSLLFVENLVPMHQADRFSDCVRAYLDEDHEQTVKGYGSSATGQFLQASLVKAVITSSFTFTIGKIDGLSWSELEPTVFGRLIQAIASKSGWADATPSPEVVFEKLILDPDLISEYLEDLFGMRQLTTKMSKEDE